MKDISIAEQRTISGGIYEYSPCMEYNQHDLLFRIDENGRSYEIIHSIRICNDGTIEQSEKKEYLDPAKFELY
jgi:hypothetical protein